VVLCNLDRLLNAPSPTSPVPKEEERGRFWYRLGEYVYVYVGGNIELRIEPGTKTLVEI
jgi:hypothetical protein